MNFRSVYKIICRDKIKSYDNSQAIAVENT